MRGQDTVKTMKTYAQASDNHAAVAEDVTKIEGLTGARVYVRLGRYASAISYLGQANPGMTSEQAKSIIDSFGYGVSTPDDEDEVDFSTRGC
jgi:hypothetical protein